jgi:hypothetical protein
MSPEFLQRAVRVPAAANPDQATAQTILIMCRDHIWPSVYDPAVYIAAADAVNDSLSGQVEPIESRRAIACAIWAYAKRNIRFIHHSKLIRDWFREVDHLQLLIQPSVLVRFPEMKWPMVGDCAIYSCLIAAMLVVYEIPWRLVTLACDPKQPAIFSHVFPRAQMEDGSWFTLDASRGNYPGWQVPAEHTFREQSWNEQGAPVQ